MADAGDPYGVLRNAFTAQPQPFSLQDALRGNIADFKAQQDALGTPFGPVQNPGVANALSSAAYMVPGLGNALSARDAYNSYNQGDARGALLGALGALTFGGPLAKTADAVKLGRAKDLLEAGATPHQIWNETGWFQGADGKWRFEIPDNGARVIKNPQQISKPTDRLGDVYEHPPLYAAYPELADTRFGVTSQYHIGQGGFGHLEDGTNRPVIVAGHDPNSPAMSVLGIRELLPHEIQHNIQKIEGFAQGGSPGDFTQQEAAKLARDALTMRSEMELHPALGPSARENAVRDEYARLGASDWLPSAQAFDLAHDYGGNPTDQLQALVSLYGLDKHVTPRDNMAIYKDLAGEREAVNAAKRRNMTPAKLQATPPWETQDIPYDQQIVRFGNNGIAESRPYTPPTPWVGYRPFHDAVGDELASQTATGSYSPFMSELQNAPSAARSDTAAIQAEMEQRAAQRANMQRFLADIDASLKRRGGGNK